MRAIFYSRDPYCIHARILPPNFPTGSLIPRNCVAAVAPAAARRRSHALGCARTHCQPGHCARRTACHATLACPRDGCALSLCSSPPLQAAAPPPLRLPCWRAAQRRRQPAHAPSLSCLPIRFLPPVRLGPSRCVRVSPLLSRVVRRHVSAAAPAAAAAARVLRPRWHLQPQPGRPPTRCCFSRRPPAPRSWSPFPNVRCRASSARLAAAAEGLDAPTGRRQDPRLPRTHRCVSYDSLLAEQRTSEQIFIDS